MNKQFSNYTKDRIREENFSDKLRYSKYWLRANTVRNNPKLDNFLTEIYYDYNKRQKLKEGIERGLTGVEALKDEINNTFEYLSNTSKQCLGAGIALILSEMGYLPSKRVAVYNIINIKNAHLYTK